MLIAGSCAAEDVTDGQNGFFIQENAGSMAEMLRALAPDRERMRRVGENAQREIYLSWEDAIAAACRRYEIVLENFRLGRYPAHKTLAESFLKGTAGSLDAVNVIRALPGQLRQAIDETARENKLRTEANRQKRQEQWETFRQRLDRYL